jgi:hypothetical protein
MIDFYMVFEKRIFAIARLIVALDVVRTGEAELPARCDLTISAAVVIGVAFELTIIRLFIE